MEKNSLFRRDFMMVVLGQIISLFGNSILRFALPLYLLNVTGSPAIFGIISACAFLPMLLLCPIGGIIADRINKRNIMVILDFSTAALILVLTIMLGRVDVVILLLVTLIVLYGIMGSYQPAVQASIPCLIAPEDIMAANSVITLVNSLSGLLGPVIGGAVFGFYGINPILYVSIGCFLFSAIMEIFIHIPFEKKESSGSVFAIGLRDMKESIHYIKVDQPEIWKVSLLIAAINLFLSSMIMIGLPIIVTKMLDFELATGNRMYGYAQGSIAAGSLAGGLLAGIFSKKIRAKHSPAILYICTLTLIPMGLALQFVSSSGLIYAILLFSCFIMLATASMFSVQMMAYLQMITPGNLIGKIISCAMCVGMCAQPIGQALYGVLFDQLFSTPYYIFYGAFVMTMVVCFLNRKMFLRLDKVVENVMKGDVEVPSEAVQG